MGTHIEYIYVHFAGEWFGLNPNVYEAGFLDTLAPKENITTITPLINGFPGPKYNLVNCF
jgi:hypothetical protein